MMRSYKGRLRIIYVLVIPFCAGVAIAFGRESRFAAVWPALAPAAALGWLYALHWAIPEQRRNALARWRGETPDSPWTQRRVSLLMVAPAGIPGLAKPFLGTALYLAIMALFSAGAVGLVSALLFEETRRDFPNV